MDKLIFFLAIIILNASMAEEKKIYTQSDMDKIVNEKISEKLDKIKDKNIVSFSKSLLKKEEKLKDLEMKLERKEEELKINSKDLDEKINRFIKKQKKFIACIGNIEKGKQRRINHLVEVIAGMKPARAGSVLSVQDSDIAVKILSELPAVKMSKIFNSMDKEISARLQKQYMNMRK